MTLQTSLWTLSSVMQAKAAVRLREHRLRMTLLLLLIRLPSVMCPVHAADLGLDSAAALQGDSLQTQSLPHAPRIPQDD